MWRWVGVGSSSVPKRALRGLWLGWMAGAGCVGKGALGRGREKAQGVRPGRGRVGGYRLGRRVPINGFDCHERMRASDWVQAAWMARWTFGGPRSAVAWEGT